MRWRRVCVDIAADGEVRGGSVEWHPDTNDDVGPEAITVMPYMPDHTPEQMFVAVLALPWYQPELPFQQHGWTHLGPIQGFRGDRLSDEQRGKKW